MNTNTFRILFPLILCLGLLFMANTAKGQKFYELLHQQGTTLGDVQQAAKTYFDRVGISKTGYKEFKRWENQMLGYTHPGGTLENFRAKAWQNQKRYKAQWDASARSGTGFCGNWTNLTSPYMVSGASVTTVGHGRIQRFAFHPTNPNILYAGSNVGGVWKSTNKGVNWTPITEDLPILSVSGIAVHPTQPNTLFVLTGDGDAYRERSLGIFKSTDGGLNWNQAWSYTYGQNVYGYDIVIHEQQPDTIYAGTSSGLIRSRNGGSTWFSILPNVLAQSIATGPANSDLIYVGTDNKLFVSWDAGNNFAEMTNSNCSGCTFPGTAASSLPAPERVLVATTPDNPNVAYALFASADSGNYLGLYKTNTAGIFWELQSNFLSKPDSLNVLGWQLNGTAHQIKNTGMDVNPNNEDQVFAAGFTLYRSNDEGVNWTRRSWTDDNPSNPNSVLPFIHADIHRVQYNGNDLWVGCDGGVFLSTDNGATFSNRSHTLENMTYEGIGVDQTDGRFIMGGTQDCGTLNYRGGLNMRAVWGGDGRDAFYKKYHPWHVYCSSQRGVIYKSTNGGGNWSVLSTYAGNGLGQWLTPYDIIDQQFGDDFVIWGDRNEIRIQTEFASGGTSAWVPIVLADTLPNAMGNWWRKLEVNDRFRVIYAAGSQNSRFLRYNMVNGNRSILTSNMPSTNGSINDIEIDKDDPNHLWIVYSGFESGKKVYESTNGGQTWVNISGTLPNYPTYCIKADPFNNLYIGTQFGVFFRGADDDDWIPFDVGLPNVIVKDIEIFEETGKLRIGTYGRGLWESDMRELSCCAEETILTGNASAGSILGTGCVISSRQNLSGTSTSAVYDAENAVLLKPGFRAQQGVLFQGKLVPCN